MEFIASSNNTTVAIFSTVEPEEFDPSLDVPAPGWGVIHVVLMATILGLALIGNTSICWIIITDQKLRSGPNKLVLNLAVCGLFTVVANGPLVLLILAEDTEMDWQYGNAACQFNGFTTSVYGLASVLTLAVISVNRYQMIRSSTGRFASWFTRSTIIPLIAGVWILSALLAFPPVVGWSQYEYIPERAICTLKWSTEISYTVFVFTLGIFLPFIVMFGAYFAIFRLVRHKFKRMREHNAKSNPQVSCTRNVSNNSSFGRFLANAAERRESQQISGQEGGASASVVFAAGADETVGGKLSPVSRNPSNAIVVSEAEQGNRAVFPEPKPELKHLGVRDANRGRSWSLVETEIKDDSNYLQVLYNAPASVSSCKNKNLAVPISYPTDHPLFAGKLRTTPVRPKSAHSRIYRTSSAPEQADVTFRRMTKIYRSGKLSSVKSSTGGAFLPPKDDLRVTVMVFAVLASFILCWSPVTLINFVESAWEVDIPLALNVFSVYMIFASSAINPLIYGMLNRNFRSGFKRLFCSFWTHCGGACKCCCMSAKKLPRQNRVSVINLNDDTLQ